MADRNADDDADDESDHGSPEADEIFADAEVIGTDRGEEAFAAAIRSMERHAEDVGIDSDIDDEYDHLYYHWARGFVRGLFNEAADFLGAEDIEESPLACGLRDGLVEAGVIEEDSLSKTAEEAVAETIRALEERGRVALDMSMVANVAAQTEAQLKAGVAAGLQSVEDSKGIDQTLGEGVGTAFLIMHLTRKLRAMPSIGPGLHTILTSHLGHVAKAEGGRADEQALEDWLAVQKTIRKGTKR